MIVVFPDNTDFLFIMMSKLEKMKTITCPDKDICERKLYLFYYLSVSLYVLGAKNLLIVTALLSTHNICFG